MDSSWQNFLANYADFLLNTKEEDKAVICDLKIVCNDDIFHSFSLIFAAISPTFLKSSLAENVEEHSMMILPNDCTYQMIKDFHQSLFSPLSQPSDLASCLELLELFRADFVKGEPKNVNIPAENPAKKNSIVCGECGKEYTSKVCFANHLKMHKQEMRILNRKEPKKKVTSEENNIGRPKREASRPKRFLEDEENEDQMLDADYIVIKKAKKKKTSEFLCQICNKALSTKTNLENHIKLHNQDREFKCEHCDKKFVSKSVLATHKITFHSENVDKNYHPCRHCSMSFKSLSNLARHTRNKHFEHSDKIFHKCTTCSKLFKDPSALKVHEKIHTGERKFACNECPKAFISSGQLTVHKRIHTGEKPYECDECSKRFKTRHQVRSHKLHRHVGVVYERNHLCPECGVSFYKAFDLKVHLLRHSGETPFHCKLCQKSFRTDRNLRLHMATHNNGEEQIFLRCEQCGKTFKSPNGLRQHLKTSETCSGHQTSSGSALETESVALMTSDSDQIQAYMVIKDGDQYLQLEDGQLLKASETIYTIKELDETEPNVEIIQEFQ